MANIQAYLKKLLRLPPRLRKLLISIAALALLWVGGDVLKDSEPDANFPEKGDSSDWQVGASAAVSEAFRKRLSDVWVEGEGRIQRTLPDDTEGSRHQRFVVDLGGGHTVLIAHNIDLAERVPLVRGDSVAFRGEFVWNSQGGVIHWTHADSRGNRIGGWIRHNGREYR